MEKTPRQIRAQKRREDAKKDKAVEKWLEKNAIKEGEDYFDKVIYALKSKLDDVKKNKRNWRLAVKGKAHPNGYVPEKTIIINQIEWNMDTVSQMDLNHSNGARAISLLTTAFKIQL